MLIAHETESAQRSMLDGLSFIVLQAFLFLTPIFFVPSVSVPFQAGKGAFLIYGIIALFLLWLAARLKDGIFSVPKSVFYASAGVLAAAYSLAAIFSMNQAVSFAGQSFELGTLAFFVPSLLLFALVPVIVRSKEHVFYSYATLLASFFLVGLFHVARFAFGPDTLSFGLILDASSNLIGKWNDVGIFFGLAALVSLITLEKIELNRLFKVLVNACFVLSLVVLVAVNFRSLWIVLAVMSLIFFVYELSLGRREEKRPGRQGISFYALAVFVISVFFVFAGAKVGGLITEALGVSQTEVRPSLSTTVEVTRHTLADKPFFGAGPNRFSSEWLLHKPVGVNQGAFWNIDFNYGVGFIPSFLATVGIVGAAAMAVFVALFLYSAFRALIKGGATPFSRYLVASSFAGAAYLWVFSFFYIPSPVIWILTMFMSGLFVASLREDGVVGGLSVRTIEKPVLNFISVLVIIFAFIGTLSFGYFVTTKLLAATFFQKAAISVGVDGAADKGLAQIGTAMSFAPYDAYSRAASELYLARIGALLNDEKVGEKEAQDLFQNYLSAAIQLSNQAIELDSTNYLNYISLGQVFESVIPLKIEGAYDEAKKAYASALLLNPESPELYLALARIDAATGDNAAARVNIGKALDKKGDYTPAVYLLAQIQIGEKNVPEAIRSVEAVATLSPNDSGAFFQLGLLYYDQKRYADAVLAFGRAVGINPAYANAKYLLGLSYYETKDTASALKQFKELQVSNPDNAEVKAIVANLEAGKAPLATPKGKLPGLPVKEFASPENI